ncbi:MAG: acetyl-CoA carboxylase biotin carboxyl carrier protein subunit, partial [Actinobacteria bacterium]|nr:acetyl-CoA carboxylase biotin carboxyl carrier protein subunit [Actinomycetota bacterium]
MGEAMDITAPMQGTIVTIDVVVGQQVRAGQQVMLIESMKMHHAIESASDGSIEALVVAVGATVMEHAVVARLAPGEVSIAAAATEAAEDPAHIR